MTSSRLQSGAHMNDRMLKRRMLSVIPRPGSVVASTARIATRSRITFRTTMRLSVGFGGTEPSRWRSTRAVKPLVGRFAQHQERTFGRHSAERHLHDLVQDVGQRLRRQQRAVHVGEQPNEVAFADRALADLDRDRPHDRPGTVRDLVVLREQILLGHGLLEHQRRLRRT